MVSAVRTKKAPTPVLDEVIGNLSCSEDLETQIKSIFQRWRGSGIRTIAFLSPYYGYFGDKIDATVDHPRPAVVVINIRPVEPSDFDVATLRLGIASFQRVQYLSEQFRTDSGYYLRFIHKG